MENDTLQKKGPKALRSARRMRTFWKQIKQFGKYKISSVISKEIDNRPYVPLSIAGKLYFALLDSGANKSVIGNELAVVIKTSSTFRRYLRLI